MALPPSGPISMSQINTELAVPATTLISLNQTNARALAGVPAGMISLSNFYGKSNVSGAGYRLGGINSAPPTAPIPAYNKNILKYSFTTETASIIAQTIPARFSPLTPPYLVGYYYTGVYGFTETNGWYSSPPPADVTPQPAATSLYQFNFTNDTIGVAINGTFSPAGTYGSARSNMQTPVKTVSILQGQPNLNTAYTQVFNFPTLTSTINAGAISNSPGVPANVLNADSYFSWSGFKNYQKGYTFGGKRPPSPAGIWVASPYNYVVQFPTNTGYTTSNTSGVIGLAPISISNAEVGYGYTNVNTPTYGQSPFASKFTFATETGIANGVNVGETYTGGTSWQTPTHGFIYGGSNTTSAVNPSTILQQVRKFSFATETKTIQTVALGTYMYAHRTMQSGNFYG